MSRVRQFDQDRLEEELEDLQEEFSQQIKGTPPFDDQEVRDAFLSDAARIRLFLKDHKLIEEYLRELNNLIVKNYAEAGIETDTLQGQHRKILRKTLENELAEAGFAPGFGKAIGFLAAKDFLYAVSQGVVLKDPGAPLNHGEFSHAIQWIFIGWHQQRCKEQGIDFLSESVVDFFKKIQFPNLWDKLVDASERSPSVASTFICPEHLHKFLLSTEDPDMALLKRLITSRAEKRKEQQAAEKSSESRVTVAGNDNLLFKEKKNKTEYDESKKSNMLLLPKTPKKN